MHQEKGVVDFYCSQEEFVCYWVRYFDLDTDYEEYMKVANPRDKYLNAAIKAGDGIRILRQDLWEMIVTFLISQQNNIKRIRKCIETICRTYGEKKISSGGVEYYAFPTVTALSGATEEELRGCGMGYRAKYIAVTARMIESGEISLEKIYDMRYHRAKKELLKLCGVGEKVAECICLFALHAWILQSSRLWSGEMNRKYRNRKKNWFSRRMNLKKNSFLKVSEFLEALKTSLCCSIFSFTSFKFL